MSYYFPFKEYFLLHENTVVRFLTLSEVIYSGAIGLLSPIFAIFIINNIQGGNAAVVGIAATIYLVTKGIVQIPVASIVDKIKGERDDFWTLFIASCFISIAPLGYLLVHTPLQLYIVQFLYGAAVGISFPTYMAVFTRHINKQKEGTAWGIYFTFNDFAAAIAAAIGGVLATVIGFRALIVGLVFIRIFAALAIIPIRSHMRMPPKKK